MLGISPHQSGASPFTRISLVFTIRSGMPMAQARASGHTFGGGMSAGLPRAAPESAHFAIIAISSSESDGSLWNCWMPMFFSTYHGGMTPARGPMPVRCFIARAQGRTSSYVVSAIGATPSGRWQFWQLRCRIGAMCLLKVTSADEALCCACSASGPHSMPLSPTTMRAAHVNLAIARSFEKVAQTRLNATVQDTRLVRISPLPNPESRRPNPELEDASYLL